MQDNFDVGDPVNYVSGQYFSSSRIKVYRFSLTPSHHNIINNQF